MIFFGGHIATHFLQSEYFNKKGNEHFKNFLDARKPLMAFKYTENLFSTKVNEKTHLEHQNSIETEWTS